MRKPLSLHIRDAHDDARAILRERSRRTGRRRRPLLHRHDLRDAQAWVALGFHISLSGVVTFKSATQIREAAAWAPLDRLLVETDCPFLAPVPHARKAQRARLRHAHCEEAGRRCAGPDEAEIASDHAQCQRCWGFDDFPFVVDRAEGRALGYALFRPRAGFGFERKVVMPYRTGVAG